MKKSFARHFVRSPALADFPIHLPAAPAVTLPQMEMEVKEQSSPLTKSLSDRFRGMPAHERCRASAGKRQSFGSRVTEPGGSAFMGIIYRCSDEANQIAKAVFCCGVCVAKGMSGFVFPSIKLNPKATSITYWCKL